VRLAVSELDITGEDENAKARVKSVHNAL